jgi:hypothetical protein
LIGRTAVHSGKDPAFVPYDQFLSVSVGLVLGRPCEETAIFGTGGNVPRDELAPVTGLTHRSSATNTA